MEKLLFIILFANFYSADASESSPYYRPESMVLITIKAGSHTKAQNEANEKECNKRGGYDVSDERDIIISTDTKDPLICITPDDKKLQEFYKAKARQLIKITPKTDS